MHMYTHRPDAEFPVSVPIFCFPTGAKLELLNQPREPESFSFLLTESDGARIYALALVFYEPVTGSGGSAPTLYAPKCLVITSHWGFCASFTHFLQQLYHGCHQGGLSFPPERLVANFICEVHLPSLLF
jgi:hypothetical protein